MTQYTPNLGQTPTDDARRDCVHIAVAPMVAGMSLDPGDHVYLASDGYVVRDLGRREESRTIGIVDPFYDGVILRGQKFWLFLYPNTITGLRHVWSHPAFRAKLPGAQS